jgi:hypothetical protein
LNQNTQLILEDNGNYSLSIIAGDSFDLKIFVTDKSAAAVDITGMSITVSIRKYIDSTALVSDLASILDQESYKGYALFQITPTMTGTTLSRGTYDLEVKFTYDSTHIKRIISELVIE